MRLIAQSCNQLDPNACWQDAGSQTIASCRIFSLSEIQRESPHSHAKGSFYRIVCPEWINVIPFTTPAAGLELLAVEQFRHGVDMASLEIPGGACDTGETPLDAAKRELLEETGFATDNWISLGSCSSNPAIISNRCHFFLALDCAPVRDLALDPAEELRVWAMPYSEWKAKLESGEVHHALMYAAFHRLYLSEAWPPLQQQINHLSNRPAITHE